MRKNNSKISVVLFAYGFMGNSTFQNLIKNDNFSIRGLHHIGLAPTAPEKLKSVFSLILDFQLIDQEKIVNL